MFNRIDACFTQGRFEIFDTLGCETDTQRESGYRIARNNFKA